jgi:hypothetical protein
MSVNDLKIGIINFIAFAVSFSNIEVFLKITLLIVSIILTILKIIEHFKNKKNETNKKL